jgi:predicted glycoside hydrolase/deacetylase ChbG (UPF0249 family)
MSRADEAARPDIAAAKSRRIWLCADDYGIAPGVNSAIRDLIARGRLNATSVMMAAPGFQHSDAVSLGILKSGGERRVAIGLHVTLTAPFKPLSRGYGPLRHGAFLPLGATLRAAFLRQLDRERLAIEIAAQIQAFATAFGRAPDFVDGHQHVQLFPQVRDVFLNVVKETAPQAWVRQCGRVTPFYQRLLDAKALFLDFLSHSFRRRAHAFGLRTNPAFAGAYDFRAQPDFAKLFPRFLDDLPAESVVMCHPGFIDPQLARLDPLTAQREQEYAFLAGDAFPAMLAEKGVTLA